MPFRNPTRACALALPLALSLALLRTPSALAHDTPDLQVPTASQPEAVPQAPDAPSDAPPTATPHAPEPEATPHAPVPAAKPPVAVKAPQVLAGEPLRAIAARLKKALPLQNGRVVVLKSQRVLQLFDGKTLIKEYSVALGESPSGAKQKRGDGRTPEGEYFICTRNAKTSAFHIFLGLSYPALPDATRGAKTKLITPREMQLIRSRQASRSAPPWNTKLGGWVGIHGGSDAPFASRVKSKRQSLDWTAGCVAVSDREIEEISAALKVGARVSIRP